MEENKNVEATPEEKVEAEGEQAVENTEASEAFDTPTPVVKEALEETKEE